MRRAGLGLCLPSLLRVCRLVCPPFGVATHHLGALGLAPLQLAPRVLRLRLPPPPLGRLLLGVRLVRVRVRVGLR